MRLRARNVSAVPGPDPWKRPEPRRVRRILGRLREAYSRPVASPHRAPLDELVLTVLSQSTNDRNRDVAYARLRGSFATWAAVRDAPEHEVEAAIRPGGISRIKSERIQRILRALGDDDLSWLEEAPLAEVRARLCALPGVGRKTAACVLLFAYGRPEVPVDTHVHRVGGRLGLFRPGASLDEAHDDALRLLGRGLRGEDAYELHVALLRHGRRTCTARSPGCGECPLLSLCPWGRSLLRGRSTASPP